MPSRSSCGGPGPGLSQWRRVVLRSQKQPVQRCFDLLILAFVAQQHHPDFRSPDTSIDLLCAWTRDPVKVARRLLAASHAEYPLRILRYG
jgi:hypothetical protein